MTLSHTPGAVQKIRRISWFFQATFRTPLTDLSRFVAAILSRHEMIEAATVTIDQVVFEPKNLVTLMNKYALPVKHGHDWSLGAGSRAEVTELLQASLGDWINFAFVPTPKPFVIYADHDEYATILSASKSNLTSVVETLISVGFKQVPNFSRQF